MYKKPQRLLGGLLIILGSLIAVGYTYLVLFSDLDTAIRVLRISAGILAILIGAFIGAVGFLLVFGWREHSIEDTGEE